MNAARISVDTDSLRTFADRSGEWTMTARAHSSHLEGALWSLRASCSEFVSHVPDLAEDVRRTLSAIERADHEAHVVAVRFDATQLGLLSALPTRRADFAGLHRAVRKGFGVHVNDPATVIVASGIDEVDASVAAALGVSASGSYEWTRFADGHIEVTETTVGSATIEGGFGADLGLWKSRAALGVSIGGSVGYVRKESFVVDDEDELRTLIQHRTLHHAVQSQHEAQGFISGAIDTIVPKHIRNGVEHAFDAGLDAIAPDLGEIVDYEPTRTGGATGSQAELGLSAGLELAVIEGAAGMGLTNEISASETVLHHDDGQTERALTLNGLSSAYLGLHGLRVSNDPLGVATSAGATMTITTVEDADGVPLTAAVQVEIEGDGLVDVDSISYDLTSQEQRAEAIPLTELVGGELQTAPSALGLVAGVFGGRATTGTMAGASSYALTRQQASVGGNLKVGPKFEARAGHKQERRTRTN